MKTPDDEKFEAEIKEGKRAITLLVEHLVRMGSPKEIEFKNVEVNGSVYRVKVKLEKDN